MAYPANPSTTPLAVKKRDGASMALALLGLVFVLAALAAWWLTNSWTIPVTLFTLALLAVIAAAIRLAGSRKALTPLEKEELRQELPPQEFQEELVASEEEEARDEEEDIRRMEEDRARRLEGESHS